MSEAFLFPGQGSQRVGMGRDLAAASPVARAVFDEADAALDFPLSALCFEGPEDALQLTENTQPAILATSIAVHRCLEERGRHPALLAGHSLGEYSALVAAGTLTLADALRLVRRRGQLMQQAVPVGEGAMAAVLGPDPGEVAAIAVDAAAATGGVCAVANFNAPGQTVIAGHRGAVLRALELARERGVKRSVLLPVSAPFHCPLMAPAREGLSPMLEATAFADPRVPVVCNVDATPVTTGAAARDALVRQIESPVRWVESVAAMIASGVNRFVEVGPGAVLAGLVKRIDRSVAVTSVGGPAELAALLDRGAG
ncbi:MAG TPA: ACP S-malonyltransferase [Thermoanaerobaculia bacterium]|nr:ACP S-malonyltransferase [Thermoanaerobaculia bacterium]